MQIVYQFTDSPYPYTIFKTEQGTYKIEVTRKEEVIFQKEYSSERAARNGTIEFLYDGPNTSNKLNLKKIKYRKEAVCIPTPNYL